MGNHSVQDEYLRRLARGGDDTEILKAVQHFARASTPKAVYPLVCALERSLERLYSSQKSDLQPLIITTICAALRDAGIYAVKELLVCVAEYVSGLSNLYPEDVLSDFVARILKFHYIRCRSIGLLSAIHEAQDGFSVKQVASRIATSVYGRRREALPGRVGSSSQAHHTRLEKGEELLALKVLVPLEVIRRIGCGEGYVPALSELLHHEDRYVRWLAVYALGLASDRRASHAILKRVAATDADPRVRWEADNAVSRRWAPVVLLILGVVIVIVVVIVFRLAR
jgi:hypothetical protein